MGILVIKENDSECVLLQIIGNTDWNTPSVTWLQHPPAGDKLKLLHFTTTSANVHLRFDVHGCKYSSLDTAYGNRDFDLEICKSFVYILNNL